MAEFEWDSGKAAANLRKHGVAFQDAVTVFDDEQAMTIRDPDAAGEARFVSMGSDAAGRVLVIVFSLPGDRVRIISARRASRGERLAYLGAH